MKNGLLTAATVAALVGVTITATNTNAQGWPCKVDWFGSSASDQDQAGDPDGSGTAEFRIHHGHKQVCFRLTVRDIEAAVTAHIHRGAEGTTGPVVITLAPPPTLGSSSGCVTDFDRGVTHQIITDPAGFYADVHNAPYPDGALRGQMCSSRN